MSLRYSVIFDERRGYYVARFWESGYSDTKVKVSPKFWKELGYKIPPTEPNPKLEKEALRWAAGEASRREANRRVAVADKQLTLTQVFELMEEKNPNNVSAATFKRNRYALRALVETVGSMSLEHIDLPIAVTHRNRRRTDGARERTIKNELSLLMQLIDFAVEWKRLTGVSSKVLTRLPAFEQQESTQVALSEEEFAAALHVAGDRDRRILITGVTTMLRRVPLLGLRSSWVDFENETLNVTAAYMKKGNARQRTALKVPVSKWTIEQLEDLEVGRSGLFWGSGQREESPLKGLDSGLETIARKAKIRPFSLHDLRTTGISWLRAARVDPLIIKILAGHSTAETDGDWWRLASRDMTDLYTRFSEDYVRAGAATFDTIRERVLAHEKKLSAASSKH